MQSVCSVLYCHGWPVRLYHIYPHYFIKDTVFGRKVVKRKICVLIFSTVLSETFLILRIIQLDIIINVQRSSCKVAVLLPDFIEICIFWTDFQKKCISNFMKILPVGTVLFHVDMTVIAAFRNFANAP
jgi:hypothetical protein